MHITIHRQHHPHSYETPASHHIAITALSRAVALHRVRPTMFSVVKGALHLPLPFEPEILESLLVWATLWSGSAAGCWRLCHLMRLNDRGFEQCLFVVLRLI